VIGAHRAAASRQRPAASSRCSSAAHTATAAAASASRATSAARPSASSTGVSSPAAARPRRWLAISWPRRCAAIDSAPYSDVPVMRSSSADRSPGAARRNAAKSPWAKSAERRN
jgi:hypothetical protein